MSAVHAKQQFEDNLKRLGPAAATSDLEKFNLYAGLANLAEELQRISGELHFIKTQIQGKG